MKEIIIATDWWIFGATIGAGCLSALATWFAVVYTNKKTVEKYEKDKLIQEKEKARVIVKPVIKFGTFASIMDELIVYNIHERVLILSSEKDGFEFYDNDDYFYSYNHSIFSIRNESENGVNNVVVKTNIKIKTESNAVIEDIIVNNINLFRKHEEIAFRMSNTKQRDRLWKELDKGEKVEVLFDASIEYITSAKEKILYKYIAKIENTPSKIEQNNEEVTTVNRKISVIKDEYNILGVVNEEENIEGSVYRNLQYKMPIDRVSYAQRKVGAAQAAGMMTEISKITNMNFNNTSHSVSEEVKPENETTI